MDLLGALQTFIRVVETGSFSAVARESGASQSAVTRQMTQLEAHFGVRLLHRTTRRLSLTDDGQLLVGHARQLLEHAGAMETVLDQHRQEPVGLVRVGTMLGGGLFLASRLPRLVARHPGLSVEVVVRDHFSDLVEARLDLALHRGEIGDSSVIARNLGVFDDSLVAAPVYLERHGTPSEPTELERHVCILLGGDRTDSALWHFIGPDGPVRAHVSGSLVTNNEQVAMLMARQGHGIALLPDIRVIDDVRAGRLIRLLSDYHSRPVPLQILYPSRRNLAPRTRVVLEFMVQEIRAGFDAARRIQEGSEDAFWA